MNSMRKRAASKVLKKIIAPLKEYIDADLFTYFRYENNACRIVANDMNEMTAFLNDEHSRLPAAVSDVSTVLHWNQFCSGDHLKMISEDLNYSTQGITFLLRHNHDFIEHISINTHNKEAHLLQNALRLNGGINSVIAHIRNYINFNYHALEPEVIEVEFPKHDVSDGIDMCSDGIELHNRLYLRGLKGETYLTRMEKKCLEQLLQLKTSDEIAKVLNSKKRTVECHIANLKNKLGIKRKPDLFNIAKNNFLIPPSFEFRH